MNKKKERSGLIQGVFKENPHDLLHAFNASVHFDKRLFEVDIEGSLAHARMLAKTGVITDAECSAIERGLHQIIDEIKADKMQWQESLEDVHMNIEHRLIELIGEAGKKLHTGRSRNDQVATDMRLWLRAENLKIIEKIKQLRLILTDQAQANAAVIMPGYTHLQAAQPITFGHHLMAWQEMLKRDQQRLSDAHERINHLPLGSAALAGTTYPIDRSFVAEQLDFEHLCENSLDAVSDRDFIIEFCQNNALLMMHFSRMCEELILWNSAQFNFIKLSDQFTTGSSIMPQKKNPDVAELIRGKAARVYGHSLTLLTLMKNQPLAYNKDNQEDKEPLFDTVDTVQNCLSLFMEMVKSMKCCESSMYAAASQGFTCATDFADYLVRKNMPFREAHAIVGKAVQLAQAESCALNDLSLSQLQGFSKKIDSDVYDVLSLEACVANRNHIGGTAPDQVKAACQRVYDELKSA